MILAHQLFSACIQLSSHAGNIIRSIHSGGLLGTFEKGKDDPCTQADIESERLIVSSFSHYFPEVKVIGEENIVPDPRSKVDLDLEVVPSSMVPGELQELEPAKVTVWVDPLDGTKNFTQNALKGVTTLIGVAYNSAPIFGVIHHVFEEQMPIYWGGANIGLFLTHDPMQKGEQYFREPCSDFSIASTRLHISDTNSRFLEHLAPDKVIREDGSGYKGLLVINGTVSMYFNETPHTKKWDICAVQALIEAIGGTLTDMNDNKYDYSENANVKNQTGFVTSRDRENCLKVTQAWQSFVET